MSNKKMSPLDNIPKKTIFSVPEGYFDKLPAEIQSRVSARRQKTVFSLIYRYGLHYALPLVVVAVILFYMTPNPPDAESILATVETKDLILYFDETSPTTTEELLDYIDASTLDVEAIEIEAYDLYPEETGDEVLELELNNL